MAPLLPRGQIGFRLAEIRARVGAEIAVLAVPVGVAAEVVEQVAAAGFFGIVNFVPVRLRIPPPMVIYSVDLTMAFEHVTFKLTRRGEE